VGLTLQAAGIKDWVPVDEYLAEAWPVHRVTLFKWVREQREGLVTKDRREVDGKRGKMALFSALPEDVRLRYMSRQRERSIALATQQPAAPQPLRTSAGQVQFPFAEVPREIALLPVPEAQKPLVWKRYMLVTESMNGAHRLYGKSWTDHFESWLCPQYGVSRSRGYDYRNRYNDVIAREGDTEEGRRKAILALMDDKRGPQGFDPEMVEPWVAERMRRLLWKGFKKRAIVRAALDEITKRQAAWGAEKIYPVPSPHALYKVLETMSRGGMAEALAHGEKRFEDKFGRYFSRDYSRLRANDLWVIDQRLCNVRLRDGSERLGRLWEINILDVGSRRWLGGSFGPILSGDMVMAAVVMAIQRAGVPKAIHEDRGKEFNCRAFNGSFRKIKGETLFKMVDGVWSLLGVRVVQAIGENPKTKIIEPWHRNCLDEFDKRTFSGHGWCGSDTDERPERLADEEAAHERLTKTGQGATPLVRIEAYIAASFNHKENVYNATHEHSGRGMNGMTPDVAWNVKRPDEGIRRIAPAELELVTAEHRKLKVARGGQINFTLHGQLIEYEDPALFLRQGEEVEVIISRRTLAQVVVLDLHGKEICRPKGKPLYDWLPENRDELRAAMRCKAAMHRAVKRGLQAAEALELAGDPVQLLQATRADSGAAPALKPQPQFFEPKMREVRKRRPEPMKFANDWGKELAAALDSK
jgi:hypothetical protein